MLHFKKKETNTKQEPLINKNITSSEKENQNIIEDNFDTFGIKPFTETKDEDLLNSIFLLASKYNVSDIQIRANCALYLEINKKTTPIENLGIIDSKKTLTILKKLLSNKKIEKSPLGRTLDQDAVEEGLNHLEKNLVFDFACNGIPYKEKDSDNPKVSGRLRVQAFTNSSGLGITARILNDGIPKLEILGIDKDTMEKIKEGALQRAGLCLVTGPTGSGKSTTLAAIMDWVRQTHSKHIVTIEDPIEYMYDKTIIKDGKEISAPSIITQQEVGKDLHSYQQGLKDVLRKAPHIILLGEIRDQETMEICMEAAQTGHLVLSTLHTTGAVKTMGRILEMFPTEKHLSILKRLSETLIFIHSQGLIPGYNGKVLNYEFLHNNVDATSSAIAEYNKGDGALKTAIKTTGNIQWDNKLIEHWKDMKISDEALQQSLLYEKYEVAIGNEEEDL